MSKRENELNNAMRSSDRPFTEYEEGQKALRRNLERLRAERLAREKANSSDTRSLQDASNSEPIGHRGHAHALTIVAATRATQAATLRDGNPMLISGNEGAGGLTCSGADVRRTKSATGSLRDTGTLG